MNKTNLVYNKPRTNQGFVSELHNKMLIIDRISGYSRNFIIEKKWQSVWGPAPWFIATVGAHELIGFTYNLFIHSSR